MVRASDTGRYGLDRLRRDYGIEPGKVRSWMRRGHVPWMPKVGKGGRLDLTADDVIHLLLLNELSKTIELDRAVVYAEHLLLAEVSNGLTTIETGPDRIVAVSVNIGAIRRRLAA